MRNRYEVKSYVTLSTGSVLDLYNTIAASLKLPVMMTRATANRAIQEEITRMVQEAKRLPLLIFDEAHHLSNDSLAELRLLTNFHMDSENRLCLLLVGLTELRRRLSMAVHESLHQRIIVRSHLGGLSGNEIEAYIDHRMKLAGADMPIFEAAAMQAIVLACNGMPRRIDRIAHLALVAAALQKARMVTAEHVAVAVEETGS